MASDVAEERLAVALEHASSARRVDIQELSPLCETGAVHTQEQQQESDASRSRRAGLDAEWADSAELVEQIFEVLCLRGVRGASALRSLAAKSRYGDDGEHRAELLPAPQPASSPGTSAAAASASSVGQTSPMVPVRMAVDLMRDAKGALVLLQVKDVVWGPARA